MPRMDPSEPNIIDNAGDHAELVRRAAELHRMLVESVQDYAIYALTRTGRIATWNPGAQRLKGYTADEIIGKPLSVFYPPDVQNDERLAHELEIARTEGRFEEEAWRVRKDGSAFWATVILSPILDRDGELIGYAKVTRDLTARREAEKRKRELELAHAATEAARAAEAEARRYAHLLEEQSVELEARHEEAQALAEELELSNEELQNAAAAAEEARDAAISARRHADELQQRYQRIFESTPLPMWTADLETMQLLDVNEVALRRYGYSRESFLGLHLHELRAADPANLGSDADRRLRASAAAGTTFTTRHRTRSGEVFDVEIRAREVTFEGKGALVAVVTDITNRLRQQTRQEFLIRATEALAGSLNYEDTIGRVVSLAAPHLADWASYSVRQGDAVHNIAVRHVDASMELLAAQMNERYPLRYDPDAAAGVSKVLATGQPEFIPDVTEDVLQSLSHDREHYRMLRGIGFRSLINVPVTWRGEVLGALGFATGDSNRSFDHEDLELAMELARRAAIALQNARAFESEHTARARAERNGELLARLQRIASRLSAAVDVSATAELIVDEAIRTAGAKAAYVVRRVHEPDELELTHGKGYPVDLVHAGVRFPEDGRVPSATVIRNARALWIESHEQRRMPDSELDDLTMSGEFGSSATLPLIVDSTPIGAVGLHFTEEREFDQDARAFIGAFADQAALAIARALLFEAERSARNFAERLQDVTAALSEAATPEQVTDIVVSAGLKVIGAGAGFVTILNDAGNALELVQFVGYSSESLDDFRTLSIDESTPVTDAVRTGQPVWLASADEAIARYRTLALSARISPFRSWAAVPLVVNGVVRGVLGLSFNEENAVGAEQKELVRSLARQSAQALERARLFEAEQRARREAAAGQARAEFLAECSRQLGSSLDYTTTLESLAHAAVPRLGDWCAVDMLVDYTSNNWPPAVKRLAVAHQDPAKVEWARDLERRHPPDWDASTGLPRVLREGVTEFYPDISEEMLIAAARSEEELALLREIQFSALICVPLKVRGRAVGGITLAMTESGRKYTEADLALAEEVATRASLAIENAELFREAQQANAAKAQFLAVMSHELRTPLNAIGGYAELLELGVRGKLNEEQANDIQRIKRSQHHLLALINDVLNFARVEAGHVQYDMKHVPLHNVLDEVVSLLVPQAKTRNISLDVAPCPDGVVAFADPEKVQQVLINLLSNAVKFTMPGGSVKLSCHLARNAIEVSVTDTGIGIPEDRLAAIFDPFVQVQSGLTRSTEGTGLGLAISRDLARGMRGDLRVESEAGKGSTFTLTLQRQPDA